MSFPGIGDEMRLHPQGSERDVHLDALGYGDTFVLFPMKDQHRRAYVTDVPDRGPLVVRVRVLVERLPEIREVRAWDVTRGVVADEVRDAHPHDGSLEPVRLRHGQSGQVTAPAPAADPQPLRVGHAAFNHGVYPGGHIPQ